MAGPKFDINAMCSILKRQEIKSFEYTDSTVLYQLTFEQLRNLYTDGFETGEIEAESLRTEVASLKEQHNSLLNVYRQNMQLVSELQEQNAMLVAQGQQLVSIIERIDSHTDSTNDGVTHDLCQEALTALPQQVKSEDARLLDAIEQLRRAKGRWNTEKACNALFALADEYKKKP